MFTCVLPTLFGQESHPRQHSGLGRLGLGRLDQRVFPDLKTPWKIWRKNIRFNISPWLSIPTCFKLKWSPLDNSWINVYIIDNLARFNLSSSMLLVSFKWENLFIFATVIVASQSVSHCLYWPMIGHHHQHKIHDILDFIIPLVISFTCLSKRLLRFYVHMQVEPLPPQLCTGNTLRRPYNSMQMSKVNNQGFFILQNALKNWAISKTVSRSVINF
jgi:hypothetical protein